MKKAIKSVILLIFLLVSVCFYETDAKINLDNYNFKGDGSASNPYIVSCVEDIEKIRDYVKNGNEFEGVYFKQTQDLDLKKENWEPIGGDEDDTPFMGTYDGNGHCIKNLYVRKEKGYGGLFGCLGGQVINLVIESGEINAPLCGSIAGKSVGEKAVIANCINKANVEGNEAAGIAGKFEDGVIANCINLGKISGANAYGVTAVNCDIKIYCSYTNDLSVAPDRIVPTKSITIDRKDLKTEKFAKKFTITAAVSKWLFLGDKNVELLQWKSLDGLEMHYSDEKNIINSIYFMNFYLLPIIAMGGGVLYLYRYWKEKNIFFNKYKRNIVAFAVIFGVLSFFLDVAVASKGLSILHIGSILFLILCNLLFMLNLGYLIRNMKFRKIDIPKCLGFVLLVVTIFELVQFRIVPRYDANIYYGSLIKGTKMFDINLISFFGSFNCWKWAQGLALLVVPFELMLPNKTIGIYIGNLIISIISLYLLFWILKKIYNKISNEIVVLCCLGFAFSPYIMGLFTYIDMDWQVTFFVIWLLAAVLAENDYLISFMGFILCFTKITGFAFYSTFLTFYIWINWIKKKKEIDEKLFNLKKVLLWIIPIIMFGILLKYGDYITGQSFYGTYVADSMINLFDKNQIINTGLHTFVFGFRWIFVALMLCALILKIVNKRQAEVNKQVIISLALAMGVVYVLLSIYKADANCPRYTTIFSVMYIILLPLFLNAITEKRIIKLVVLVMLNILLIVQTFWTIDPSITLYADTIDTGVKKMYKLAYKGDDRAGMNLAGGAEGQYPILSDIYTYNLEYTFYDELLERTLELVNWDVAKKVYVLDISPYELNISGRGYGDYRIYWDREKTYRTFEKEGNIYVDVGQLYSEEIVTETNKEIFEKNYFYMIVPGRIDETAVVDKLLEAGYNKKDYNQIENCYGKLRLYFFEKES